MNYEEAIKKIRAVFAETMPPAAPPAEPKPAAMAATDYKLVDGTLITVSELMPGGTVMKDGAAVADGEYVLEDGTKLEVSGGAISEVSAPGEMKKAPDYTAQFAAIEGRLAKAEVMCQGFEAALVKSGETIKGLFEIVEALTKVPTAEPAAPQPQRFEKVTRVATKQDFMAELTASLEKIKNKK